MAVWHYRCVGRREVRHVAARDIDYRFGSKHRRDVRRRHPAPARRQARRPDYKWAFCVGRHLLLVCFVQRGRVSRSPRPGIARFRARDSQIEVEPLLLLFVQRVTVHGYALTAEEAQALGPAPQRLDAAGAIGQGLMFASGLADEKKVVIAEAAAPNANAKLDAVAGSGLLSVSFEDAKMPADLKFQTPGSNSDAEPEENEKDEKANSGGSTPIGEFGEENGHKHLIVPPNSCLAFEGLHTRVAPNGDGQLINRYTLIFECKVWKPRGMLVCV